MSNGLSPRVRLDVVHEVLWQVTFSKSDSGAMIDAVDDHALRFKFNAKENRSPEQVRETIAPPLQVLF